MWILIPNIFGATMSGWHKIPLNQILSKKMISGILDVVNPDLIAAWWAWDWTLLTPGLCVKILLSQNNSPQTSGKITFLCRNREMYSKRQKRHLAATDVLVATARPIPNGNRTPGPTPRLTQRAQEQSTLFYFKLYKKPIAVLPVLVCGLM